MIATQYTKEETLPCCKTIAEEHLPLVAAMVRRFPDRHHEREELYQQGCVGLMKAISRYDPDYGVAFASYASAMILGEMRMLRRMDTPLHIPRRDREQRSRIRQTQSMLTAYLNREPTVTELANALRMDAAELVFMMEEVSVTSMDAPILGKEHSLVDYLPDQDGWMNRLLLRDMISRLEPRDQRLLFLRFRYGMSQADTGHVLGMTQVQVSRREISLKEELRRQWLAE